MAYTDPPFGGPTVFNPTLQRLLATRMGGGGSRPPGLTDLDMAQSGFRQGQMPVAADFAQMQQAAPTQFEDRQPGIWDRLKTGLGNMFYTDSPFLPQEMSDNIRRQSLLETGLGMILSGEQGHGPLTGFASGLLGARQGATAEEERLLSHLALQQQLENEVWSAQFKAREPKIVGKDELLYDPVTHEVLVEGPRGTTALSEGQTLVDSAGNYLVKTPEGLIPVNPDQLYYNPNTKKVEVSGMPTLHNVPPGNYTINSQTGRFVAEGAPIYHNVAPGATTINTATGGRSRAPSPLAETDVGDKIILYDEFSGEPKVTFDMGVDPNTDLTSSRGLAKARADWYLKAGQVANELNSQTMPYADAARQMGNIMNLLSDNNNQFEGWTGANDMALMFTYMRLLDPDSVVRESEYQVVASLGSLSERGQALIKRLTAGEQSGPEIRRDLINSAKAIAVNRVKNYDQQRSKTYNVIDKSGHELGISQEDLTGLRESAYSDVFSQVRSWLGTDLAITEEAASALSAISGGGADDFATDSVSAAGDTIRIEIPEAWVPLMNQVLGEPAQ